MIKAKRKVACFTREGVFVKEYTCAKEAEKDGYIEGCVLTACDAFGCAYSDMVWRYMNE